MCENTNTAPFAEGQRVMCLEDGWISGIKKEDIYTVKQMLPRTCCGKVNSWWLMLYEFNDPRQRRCASCKKNVSIPGFWFNANAFVPIETQYADMTKEIAASIKHTDEVPDKILIPEIAN